MSNNNINIIIYNERNNSIYEQHQPQQQNNNTTNHAEGILLLRFLTKFLNDDDERGVKDITHKFQTFPLLQSCVFWKYSFPMTRSFI